MKQQMQALLRKEITHYQDIREFYKNCVDSYMRICTKEDADKLNFYQLNSYRNDLRKVDAKLKKLREMQKTLKSIDGFFSNGIIFDSQMNTAEVRWM